MTTLSLFAENGNNEMLLLADEGQKMLVRIKRRIEDSKETDLLVLDFKGIKVADASFIREAFCELITWLNKKPKRPRVLFRHVNEYLKTNLDLTFRDLGMFALAKTDKGDVELIGDVSSEIERTAKALLKEGRSTTRVLKDKLNIKQTAVNNRLAKMLEMCIVSRKELVQESGGIEYVYEISG